MIVEQPNGKRKEERLREMDLVALLGELPETGLARGQVGTVVFAHGGNGANGNGGDYEVEFVQAGRESIITTVPRGLLLKLKGLQEVRPGAEEEVKHRKQGAGK